MGGKFFAQKIAKPGLRAVPCPSILILRQFPILVYLYNLSFYCYFNRKVVKMRGMTSLMQRANAWSQLVIGAAIEVHRIKGPGLIEEIYSKCLGRECELRNIPFTKECEFR
jgi:hypothetical protein